MNLNLMEPRLIAPVIEVVVLIAIPIAVFVQKRRKITALLRDRFGAEQSPDFLSTRVQNSVRREAAGT